MSTTYKYQDQFALRLSRQWMNGDHEHVRGMIRHLKNKAQASHIAATIAHLLPAEEAKAFAAYLDPNHKDPL